MASNWSGGRVIGVMLLVTASGFVLGMIGLSVLWTILRLLGFSPDFWAMTEALATAVAAAAVLGGVILAYRELAEASTTRHIEVADRLFDELNDPANLAARRHVFQALPDDPAAGSALLSVQDRDAIKHVLNSLDRVAFLTQAGWIPEDMVMPWMSPMILKSWIKLQPWVDYEAERRREPEYYRQVGVLGERCLAWRKAHGLRTDVTWVEDAL
jgi:hypothetical protein